MLECNDNIIHGYGLVCMCVCCWLTTNTREQRLFAISLKCHSFLFALNQNVGHSHINTICTMSWLNGWQSTTTTPAHLTRSIKIGQDLVRHWVRRKQHFVSVLMESLKRMYSQKWRMLRSVFVLLLFSMWGLYEVLIYFTDSQLPRYICGVQVTFQQKINRRFFGMRIFLQSNDSGEQQRNGNIQCEIRQRLAFHT